MHIKSRYSKIYILQISFCLNSNELLSSGYGFTQCRCSRNGCAILLAPAHVFPTAFICLANPFVRALFPVTAAEANFHNLAGEEAEAGINLATWLMDL